MNTPEENIRTILADWLDALRRRLRHGRAADGP